MKKKMIEVDADTHLRIKEIALLEGVSMKELLSEFSIKKLKKIRKGNK